MARPTTKLSAQDRVILFCAATGIDHAAVGITARAMQAVAIRGFIAHDSASQDDFPEADPARGRQVVPPARPWI